MGARLAPRRMARGGGTLKSRITFSAFSERPACVDLIVDAKNSKINSKKLVTAVEALLKKGDVVNTSGKNDDAASMSAARLGAPFREHYLLQSFWAMFFTKAVVVFPEVQRCWSHGSGS